MEGDKKLQSVTKEVLSFAVFKLNIIKELPSIDIPSISSELVENLRTIVWVERYVSIEDSKDFVWKNHKRMAASPHLYTTYVIFACHLVNKCFLDPYEVFVRTMTLVIQLAIYSTPELLSEQLGLSLVIFTNFFEKELKEDFYNRGGWKKLNKFLLRRNSLTLFESVDLLEMQGKRPDEMVELLQFKTTVLEQYLSRNIPESEIKSHEPTIDILKMVETAGLSTGSLFLHHLKNSQVMAAEEILNQERNLRRSTNEASISREANNDSDVPTMSSLEQGQSPTKGGITNRIAFHQAKDSLKNLQADCQRIEQLLDVIFGDTPKYCQ